jgi:DNA-binding SARP family transcriptional activator
MHVLRAQLLGDFRIEVDGTVLRTIYQPRLQSVIGYLLLHRHTPQLRQQLAFMLFPDSHEAQALTNLRKQLFLLRRAWPEIDGYLIADSATIQWRPDAPLTCDVEEFADAVEQSLALTGDMAISALERAAEFYRGDLLPACYDTWIVEERARLLACYLEVLERLTLAQEDRRNYHAAIRTAEKLLVRDPLHETTYRRLMRLHALNGDRAAALHVYRRCVALLQSELDVEPNAETRAAYARLLQEEVPAVLRVRHPERAATDAPFVGRQAEWQLLQTAWRNALHGNGTMALIAGQAGIGKSRLAEELIRWVDSQGIITAHSRSYEAEGRLPYAPLIEWLRTPALKEHLTHLNAADRVEIARLMPELLSERPELPLTNPATESWQRYRLFEALARAVLVGRKPMLLVIDDLQWCDKETIEWLHFLLRQNPNAPLLCIGTARLEEISPRHPVAALRFGFRGSRQLTEIALTELTAADTTLLATQIIGGELEPEAAAQLYQETEGNPLFVVELVRADQPLSAPVRAVASGAAPASSQPVSPLPLKVKTVIESRIMRLSPLARIVADVAAVIGRDFGFAVLVSATDQREADVVAGLDELLHQSIVRERGVDGYDFSHDKIREVVYEQVSTTRRRLFHRRVAQALELLHAENPDQVSGQLAAHYERAALLAQAIPCYRRAAQAALHSFAVHEAIEHYRRGLALLETLPETRERWQQELGFLIELGSALVTVLGYGNQQVYETYTRAAALAQQLGEPTNPAILRGLALFHVTRRQYREAYALGEEIHTFAQQNGSVDPTLALEGRYVMGVAAHWQGQYRLAHDLISQAIDEYAVTQSRSHIAIFSQDPGVVCRIRLAVLLCCLGYPDQAKQYAETALALARQLAHPMTLAYALIFAAYVSIGRRDDSTTSLIADEVVTLCRRYDMPYFLYIGLAIQGLSLAARGELEVGIARIRAGIEGQQSIHSYNHLPQCMYMLAQVYLQADQIDRAQATLDDGLASIIHHGDHHYAAPYYCLKGELLDRSRSVPSIVEACFQNAYTIAREQHARTLELHAALRLCRFWQRQGKRAQAHRLLSASYSWFTEGFDTPDLQEAGALLAELA